MDQAREIDRAVAGAAAAHQALMAHLDGLLERGDLDGDVVVRPSLLAGWTVGHVLTHIARNADSHARILEAAGRGEVVDQYDGGFEGRAAEIEAGAGRPAAEQVADVRTSAWALEAAWATCPSEGWAGHGRGSRGDQIPVADLPFRRWREVVVHHVDLGLGYGWSEWPAEYVRLELDRQVMAWRARMGMGLTTLPPAALALHPNERLAWLLGRHQVADLADPEPFA
jgi:maleylpyruvate isomerase